MLKPRVLEVQVRLMAGPSDWPCVTTGCRRRIHQGYPIAVVEGAPDGLPPIICHECAGLDRRFVKAVLKLRRQVKRGRIDARSFEYLVQKALLDFQEQQEDGDVEDADEDERQEEIYALIGVLSQYQDPTRYDGGRAARSLLRRYTEVNGD